MLFVCVLCMLFLITSCSYFIFTSITKTDIQREYASGKLITTFAETETGISDIITLTKNDVLMDNYGLSTIPHSFEVKNTSDEAVLYQIILEEDTEMVKMDNCEALLADINAIKYSFDGLTVSNLVDHFEDNHYILLEESIAAQSSKTFNLYIWSNPTLLENVNHNHFHGKILIKTTK